MLYFIKTEDWYKVGFTTSIKSRMESYATHNPSAVLLGVKEGTVDDESDYHNRFSGFEQKLEWFKLSDEMVETVSKEFQPYIENKPKPEWFFDGKEYKLWCRKSKRRQDMKSPVEISYYEGDKRVVKSLGFSWDYRTFKEDSKKEPLKLILEEEIKKHIN